MRFARRLATLLPILIAMVLAVPCLSRAADGPEDLAAYVAQEFGSGYKLDTKIAPMYGDFDGDGQQDLAVVATGDNPLMGETKFNYKVSDPYNGSFGYGDPKITLTFGSGGTSRFILIAHTWQHPKAKFVLVNVPVDSATTFETKLKKKSVTAIKATDAMTHIEGAVFYQRGKYKWEIIGSEAD